MSRVSKPDSTQTEMVARGGYWKFFIAKVLFRPMETLYLSTREIGVPIYIQHGFSTVIAAKEVGSYCWVNQHVT